MAIEPEKPPLSRKNKACLSGCCTHILFVLSRSARRRTTCNYRRRSLYQISSGSSRMRVLAMLIFTRLDSLVVSSVPIVVGWGVHTVSRSARTCCVAEVAGVIPG